MVIRDHGYKYFIDFHIDCLSCELWNFLLFRIFLINDDKLFVVIEDYFYFPGQEHLGDTFFKIIEILYIVEVINIHIDFLEFGTSDCPNLHIKMISFIWVVHKI